MTDLYKPFADDDKSAASNKGAHDPHLHDAPAPAQNEGGRALIAAVLGGIVSGAGYLIYSRLPDEQKDRLHSQVRTLAESRLNEIRSRFNV